MCIRVLSLGCLAKLGVARGCWGGIVGGIMGVTPHSQPTLNAPMHAHRLLNACSELYVFQAGVLLRRSTPQRGIIHLVMWTARWCDTLVWASSRWYNNSLQCGVMIHLYHTTTLWPHMATFVIHFCRVMMQQLAQPHVVFCILQIFIERTVYCRTDFSLLVHTNALELTLTLH